MTIREIINSCTESLVECLYKQKLFNYTRIYIFDNCVSPIPSLMSEQKHCVCGPYYVTKHGHKYPPHNEHKILVTIYSLKGTSLLKDPSPIYKNISDVVKQHSDMLFSKFGLSIELQIVFDGARAFQKTQTTVMTPAERFYCELFKIQSNDILFVPVEVNQIIPRIKPLLTETERHVLDCYYLNNFTIQQTADALGIHKNDVAKHKHSAFERIKKSPLYTELYYGTAYNNQQKILRNIQLADIRSEFVEQLEKQCDAAMKKNDIEAMKRLFNTCSTWLYDRAKIDTKKSIYMRENFLRYNVSISYLNLTTRASNALKRNGIETIGQLIKVTISDVSNMKGVGKKVVNELISKLQAYDMLDADCDKIRLTKESFKKLTQE